MYPLLYGKNKSGKIKTWSISVVEQLDKSLIIIRHGYKDGKIIEQIKEITRGTNVGKKNELNHLQNAHNEALSKWKKKTEEGYSESVDNIKQFFGPMLALKFLENKHNVTYPCYVQPKKDGVRCIYDPSTQQLYTRTGKVITNAELVRQELIAKYKLKYKLDGELMNTSVLFETFTGLINKKKLSDADKLVLEKTQFIVFDLFLSNDLTPFYSRLTALNDLFRETKFKPFVIKIKTEVAKNEVEVKEKLGQYTKVENEEGVIVRNRLGIYKANYRSKDLLKYKLFEDAEYTITGFTQGEGGETGCVIWICETEDKKYTFNVRPRGSFDERKILFKNGDKYIGKRLTVRYQELFKETGIPRFVVGLGIRDYE